MKPVIELNEKDFDEAISAADTPVVVDFFVPWCGPCKMIAPLLDKLAEQFAGRLQFFKVNVDEAPALAASFEITGVPTLLLINQGKVVKGIVGFPSPRVLVTQLEALAAANGATAPAEVCP